MGNAFVIFVPHISPTFLSCCANYGYYQIRGNFYSFPNAKGARVAKNGPILAPQSHSEL